jgi:hypothetical protein
MALCFMTHSHIQDNDVRDRYVTGRLPAEERSAFEEHLSDCPECLDEVETLERFRRSLRTALTEDVVRGIALQTGVRGWFMRGGRIRQAALFMGLILLLFVPVTLAYIMANRRAMDQLGQMRATLADLQHEYSEQRQSTEKLKEQLRDAQENGRRAAARQTGTNEANTRIGLPASLPLFALNRVRDTDQGSPPNEVSIAKSSRWLILLLEVEPDPEVQFYRSKLFNEGNQLIWSANNLKLSRRDMIAVIVSNDLLKRGNYTLKLEGCDKQRYCYSVATYSFRTTTPE